MSTDADQRLAHGRSTRQRIMASARDLAAVDGLDGVTVGRLATATGLSKAGVFAHYGSKEAIQLAVIDDALAELTDRVIDPALRHPAGLDRFRALVGAYLDDVAVGDRPGGCFFAAAGLEFANRPGAVAARLAEIRAAWDDLARSELAAAADRLDPATDLDQLAFELLVILQGTASAFALSGDPGVVERGRRAVDRLLGAGSGP